jgi:predicted ATP-binding protein involved in virulence
MFRFDRLQLDNFRCFEHLNLPIEKDLTVFFADNGGGKSAILSALAMGIAVFQPQSPKSLKLNARRDIRGIPAGDGSRRQSAGPCSLTWVATVDPGRPVEWGLGVNPASGRRSDRKSDVLDAIETIRVPDARWPLFAWYGADRLLSVRRPPKPARDIRDRWAGYASSLDRSVSEAQLLDTLEAWSFLDFAHYKAGERTTQFAEGVFAAMARATSDVAAIQHQPLGVGGPVVRFKNGHVAPWAELSDGYHIFLALVGDIARRAVLLNETDGPHAPERIAGVVLIDEIDLHLHPRWQRVALDGLRRAFPLLQFVVTTHSPQVLSSVENRQVRRLSDWKLEEFGVFVAGRDSNAILRETMDTDDRDDDGVAALRKLYDAIDDGNRKNAEQLYRDLLARWGDLDPELIRARGLMEWEE